MNHNDFNQQKFDQLVDRLVCGELDEEQRLEMLASLELRPENWRQVGLAFMEAQSWTEAMEPRQPSTRPTLPISHIVSPSFDASSRPSQSVWNWITMIAAMCLISFTLGWLFRQTFADGGNLETMVIKDMTPSPLPKNGELVWATIDSRVMLVPIQGARVQVPLRIEDGKIQSGSHVPDMSDYEMARFRRHGIALKPEKKFISATLPDGRNVAIPLDGYVATHSPQMVN